MTKIAVVAIGGNSLITDREHQTVPDQYRAVAETCTHIAGMIRHDYKVVITHGNGPQIGFILRRAEMALSELHMVPLDSCGADTQGALGYHIQCALGNEFKKKKMDKQAVTIVTLVIVDADAPSFKTPSKPIGSFLSKEQAEAHREKDGWSIVEDAGRGWRRVVASPAPRKIVEIDAIKSLVDSGFVVIAAGGGGVPVIRDENGELRGAPAVIDKDLTSSLLARELKADLLVICTAVEKVLLDFGKPEERPIDKMTAPEARGYMKEGHFKPGSMLPKIQAAVEFLENGGVEVVITNPENLERAVAGETGTHIFP